MKLNRAIGGVGTGGSEFPPIDHAVASNLILDAELCDQAMAKASSGDYRAAYDMITQILDKDSPLKQRAVEIAVRLIDGIVSGHLQEQNYDAAMHWLDEWQSIDPEAIYPAVAKADLLWIQMDMPEEALPIYRSIVRKYPRCLEGWIGLAQIALSKGHSKQGLRYIQRAWSSLVQPVWAYSPPTRAVVVNVMESLYAITAKALVSLGKKQEGVDLLRRAMLDWGSSEYLLQTLEYIEKRDD